MKLWPPGKKINFYTYMKDDEMGPFSHINVLLIMKLSDTQVN